MTEWTSYSTRSARSSCPRTCTLWRPTAATWTSRRPPRPPCEQALSARPDVVFHTLDLAALLQSQPERIQADLGPLMNRFAAGQLQPLPSRCFSLADAQNAFRFMRSARHIGKIVIQPDRSARETETAGELAPVARACRDACPDSW